MITNFALRLDPSHSAEVQKADMVAGEGAAMMTSVASSMMTSVASAAMTSVAQEVSIGLEGKLAGAECSLMTSVAEV